MVLIWRGWGALSFFIPVFFLLLPVLWIAGTGLHEPEGVGASRLLLRGEALSLAVAALLQAAIVRYRSRTAPGIDTLLFLPAGYWLGVTAAGAVIMLGLSFLGLDLSGGY